NPGVSPLLPARDLLQCAFLPSSRTLAERARGHRLISESAENYLKAIYKLEVEGREVATGDLAHALGISAPSVSRMLRKLSERCWVSHSAYRGVRLTDEGRRQALRVIRNHRILESYLAEVLGVPWDRVDEEVERLEHAVSGELINRMDEALGFPKHDPHGSPIPDRNGNMPERDGSVPLVELATGAQARVRRIAGAAPDELAYLEEKGVLPGAPIRLLRREPFEGPLVMQIGTRTVFLGLPLARQILVESEP
ncbi:MAG: metal-dependent transcriptional regulator, partial [Planctomycetota bacterium]